MDKLFGIPELLININENLTTTDQLRLAQVNSSTSRVFGRFIFPKKYHKLKIKELRDMEEILVTNDKNEECMLQTHNEINNFFKFGADYIEELQVISEEGLSQFWLTIQKVSWESLQNLTCLHYRNLLLSNKHLTLIAANCPKLSELWLSGCKTEEKEIERSNLIIGQCVSLSTLEQMKNLKTLAVYGGRTISMSLFCDLITKVPLECLKLNAILVQDMHDNVNKITFHHQLKELKIELRYDSWKFLESAGILKNLKKLHVNELGNTTESVLHIIAKACENLECLTFAIGSHFETTTHFVIPPNLKELSVSRSPGLKPSHITDALTKFKLEKFECITWCDASLFRDFTISPLIKVLNLLCVNTCNIPSCYTNNKTLKELHWYENGQNVLNADQNRQTLKTCQNLEALFIHSGYVPLNVILELNHLHKLQIPAHIEELNWSYIIGILKHSSLKEFHIDGYISELNDTPTDVPGFPSSLTLISISFDVFKKGLEFWLDMLRQNPKMSIKCTRSSRLDTTFLEKLIRHENFPTDVREINIFGFNINCKDLRENSLATVRPLKLFDEYDHENDTVVLSR